MKKVYLLLFIYLASSVLKVSRVFARASSFVTSSLRNQADSDIQRPNNRHSPG